MTGEKRMIDSWELEKDKMRTLFYQRICPVCKRNMILESCEPQWAHKIPQTKANIKYFGNEVIHHRLNRELVCSLKCNSSVLINPATRPLKAARLLEKISEDLKK